MYANAMLLTKPVKAIISRLKYCNMQYKRQCIYSCNKLDYVNDINIIIIATTIYCSIIITGYARPATRSYYESIEAFAGPELSY